MNQTDRCNACGADLSSGASPEGYCPKCLLAFALEKSEPGLPEAESDLGRLEAAAPAAGGPGASIPDSIGPFRILKKLGEGGMGEVFLAEQIEPVRRRVALKLIKPGMDSRQVLARFESEKQALALMDHPCIAKVFDGGTTEQGRPYFAMEYIEGEPITQYCDRHRLDMEARLELFMRVCEGVQHAHQKGVIHRDIKPSNVLVRLHDSDPLPTIIDFGVAKATQQRLTERTVFTRLGVLIGTPEYMSPEQAEMTSLDVDTRTDVYSLGVLLYELLVGALPFDPEELRQAGFDEIRRKIREDEPSKPSTRVATLGEQASTDAASRRRVDTATLRRQLQGDLDWITMRALEKDRAQRYGSPSDLAADVRRHLLDEPVLAGPPSVTYRTRKFVRRHRVGVGVASAALLVLIAFAVTMTTQARRIARERDRTALEAEKSSQIAEFMTGLFNQSNPSRKKGEAVTVEQMLDRAAERIATELIDEPEIRGSLMHTIGAAYFGLGAHTRAEQLLREASEIERDVLGEMHPDTLKTDWLLATTLRRLNRLDDADTLMRRTLERQRVVLGDDHKDTLRTWNSLAGIVGYREGAKEAAAIFEQIVSIAQRKLGPRDGVTMAAMHNLAWKYLELDRLEEAESIQRVVIENKTEVMGEDHPSTLGSMHVLAVTLKKQGRLDDAEAVLTEVVEGATRVLPEDHILRCATVGDLASVHYSQERYEEAEAGFRASYESYRESLGENHPRTVWALHKVALALFSLGRLADSERLELEVLPRHRRITSDEHPRTLEIIEAVARLYNEMGDSERAREYAKELIGTRESLAARPDASASAKLSYARLLLECVPEDLRDPRMALQVAREALEIPGAPEAELLDAMALASYRSGNVEQAVEFERRAIEALSDGRAEARQTFQDQLERYEAELTEEDS